MCADARPGLIDLCEAAMRDLRPDDSVFRLRAPSTGWVSRGGMPTRAMSRSPAEPP
ncbi:hypothetical protein DUI70_5780 [Streptomyces albus]|nr:hypothetical protein DUI70_5780 [Streptomyces albus]